MDGKEIQKFLREQQAKKNEHEDDDTSEEEELDLAIGDYVELAEGVKV